MFAFSKRILQLKMMMNVHKVCMFFEIYPFAFHFPKATNFR
jgi:hypothetical protein